MSESKENMENSLHLLAQSRCCFQIPWQGILSVFRLDHVKCFKACSGEELNFLKLFFLIEIIKVQLFPYSP